MNSELILTLLHRTESDTLDFKSKQYPFVGATDVEKAELLKDILAFANAWKTEDAFIVIGAAEQPGGRAQVVGVSDHLADSTVQQFVNSKTNTPVSFLVGTYDFEGKKLDIIRIDRNQRRPIHLLKPFARPHNGGLDECVYVRRGSSTAIASPTEIAAMGAADQARRETPPQIEIEFAPEDSRVRLGLAIACTSVRLLATDQDPGDEEAVAPSWPGLGHRTFALRGLPPSEVFKNRQGAALVSGLGFWLKNSSTITAEDVRVQLRLPVCEGFGVLDGSDVPSIDEHPSPNFKTIHSKLTVSKESADWVVEISVGKLRPQQEVWTEEPFYVGAVSDNHVEGVVRVFDDRLPAPLERAVTLVVRVSDRDYDEADFEDESLPWKPTAERLTD